MKRQNHKIIFILFIFVETDGKFRAVANDDDDSAADHIETVGAQRCGEPGPENRRRSQCKFSFHFILLLFSISFPSINFVL